MPRDPFRFESGMMAEVRERKAQERRAYQRAYREQQKREELERFYEFLLDLGIPWRRDPELIPNTRNETLIKKAVRLKLGALREECFIRLGGPRYYFVPDQAAIRQWLDERADEFVHLG